MLFRFSLFNKNRFRKFYNKKIVIDLLISNKLKFYH